MKFSVRHGVPFAPDGAPFDSHSFEGPLPVFDSPGGGAPLGGQYTGIRALMLAVLEEGIRNYLGAKPCLRSDAAYWIASTSGRSPFAFRVICETLGLEPSAVRVALQRLRERNATSREAIGRHRPNVRHRGPLLARKAS